MGELAAPGNPALVHSRNLCCWKKGINQVITAGLLQKFSLRTKDISEKSNICADMLQRPQWSSCEYRLKESKWNNKMYLTSVKFFICPYDAEYNCHLYVFYVLSILLWHIRFFLCPPMKKKKKITMSNMVKARIVILIFPNLRIQRTWYNLLYKRLLYFIYQ